MKIISTLFLSLTLFVFGFSQGTSTILLDEKFESFPASSDLTFNGGSIFQRPDVGFDGQAGSGSLNFFDETFIQMNWTGDIPTETSSLSLTFKMDKNTSNFAPILEFDNSVNINSGYSGTISYSGSQATFNVFSDFLTSEFDSMSDSNDFWLLTKNLTPVTSNNSYLIASFFINYEYQIMGMNGTYTESNAFAVANEYCNTEFPGDVNCSTNVQTELFSNFTNIKVDDFVLTAYSTNITGVNMGSDSKKTVTHCYNLMGFEIDKETKNEIIILKYSDGTSRRVLNQE